MITIHYRAANDFDLQASRRDRGSLVRNLTTVSLPASAVAFGFAYGIWRSFSVASAVGISLLASSWSNLSFFRKLRGYERLKTDPMAVEVLTAIAGYSSSRPLPTACRKIWIASSLRAQPSDCPLDSYSGLINASLSFRGIFFFFCSRSSPSPDLRKGGFESRNCTVTEDRLDLKDCDCNQCSRL